MSVPLDRLYNFLHDVCNHDDVVIYRFFPHGSRKITDLKRLGSYGDIAVRLKKFVFFNDQEPLNFDLYNDASMFYDLLEQSISYAELKTVLTDELQRKYMRMVERTIEHCNLKLAVGVYAYNFPVLLVHSEKRSKNLETYQSYDFITVYWWSHAMIARDWFRYAESDPALASKEITKDFLIYNRAWSGTREYRLKFAELIVDNNLHNSCQMGFNPEDQGHYRDHKFANPSFNIVRKDLENYFHLNISSSSASADYSTKDYQQTAIEVVLETLFDDERLHLTEKALRPIACGQPFMMLGTHGSLEYLKDYGFKTFNGFINEEYDKIIDPAKRLEAVVKEMKRISLLPLEDKKQLFLDMQKIADYNKQLFFSKEWEQTIINEYKTNFEQAKTQLDQTLMSTTKNFNLL